MKKQSKKLLSLALALTMVLSLAACGKTGGESQSGTDGQITLNLGIQIRANVESVTDNDLTRYLEEKTGYKLEFTEFSTNASEWRSQFNTMVASGEKLPDIMFGFGWNDEERYTYGADGYLVDMTRFFEDEELTADYRARMAELYGDEFYDTMLKYLRSPDGAIYGYPNVNFSSSSGPKYNAYINTTWLDKLGLEMPETYEELVEVLRAFKTRDPNGNDKADEIPAIGLVPPSNTTTGNTTSDLPAWIMNNWLYLDDSKFFNSEDGKLYSPYVTEEYREGLKALNDLVKEGLLSTMCWTMSADTKELEAVWGPVNNTAICGVVGGAIDGKMPAQHPAMYEYEALPPLKYAPMAAQIPPAYIYITEDCENPEAAFNLLMAMSTEEGSMRIRYGVEGTHWEWQEDDSEAGKGVKQLITWSGGSHKVNWGIYYGVLLRYDPQETPYHTIRDPEAVWINDRNDRARAHTKAYEAMAEANNPDEVVDKLLYTTQEKDTIGNIDTEVLIYVKEARAKFATGILDPYNDADWNTYLATLEDMGLQIWLDNAQSAWDRLNAN